MALTSKQEKFCQLIIKGLNQSDAYRKSYNCDNMKDDTINNNAYKLINNNDIVTRINELKGKIEEKLVYSALQSFNKLKEIQQKALENKKLLLGKRDDEGMTIEVEDPDFSAALKAEELAGKLAGLYVEKKELTGKDGQPLVQKVFVTKQDDEDIESHINNVIGNGG